MTSTPRFCSDCGTALNAGARFCHSCGAATDAAAPRPNRAGPLVWVPSFIAVVAIVALISVQLGSRDEPSAGPMGAARAQGNAPDLSTMSAEEQASRLFDRVMRLSSEGKSDSVAFFAPMALGAIEAAGPLDNHRRYDLGMVALATGNTAMAGAEADTILASRPSHLLGLALGVRVAEARKNASAVAALRKRLVDAEASERAANLPEYSLHDNDVREAIRLAKGK